MSIGYSLFARHALVCVTFPRPIESHNLLSDLQGGGGERCSHAWTYDVYDSYDDRGIARDPFARVVQRFPTQFPSFWGCMDAIREDDSTVLIAFFRWLYFRVMQSEPGSAA